MNLRLDTPRLVLREPDDSDAPALLAYASRNESRFARWEPENVDDLGHHLRWVRWRRAESAAQHGISLLALDRAVPGALAGVINLYGITGSPTFSAMLGYSLDGVYEGKGFAREAVGAVVAHAFGTLNLHRISANYHPANERSGVLLRGLGFVVEGYARDMLYLRGTWRDHILTSLTNPNWKPPGAVERDRRA
ncbi:MAG: [ribosomal protein S5]-alanine N-acetyltransferase [Candidatus Eremiobacteraeota bacterium]|nr:[ribosomal protein S5]-alanine N-acetyltransferase [Candidatus Eremiobacteraeota bacterium]